MTKVDRNRTRFIPTPVGNMDLRCSGPATFWHIYVYAELNQNTDTAQFLRTRILNNHTSDKRFIIHVIDRNLLVPGVTITSEQYKSPAGIVSSTVTIALIRDVAVAPRDSWSKNNAIVMPNHTSSMVHHIIVVTGSRYRDGSSTKILLISGQISIQKNLLLDDIGSSMAVGNSRIKPILNSYTTASYRFVICISSKAHNGYAAGNRSAKH